MIGVYVTVPVACFRKGLAREFLETEPLPPPATCYGLMLSLVGETNRERHIGCRITAGVITRESRVGTVLRSVWRLKYRDRTPGALGNTRPDFQQLLTNVQLVIWLDSAEEEADRDTLESRVVRALNEPSSIKRFGGLSLGESTHLVDEVSLFHPDEAQSAEVFLLSANGRLTLPVWVDHVGSVGTNYATGNLEETFLVPPSSDAIPTICPKE